MRYSWQPINNNFGQSFKKVEKNYAKTVGRYPPSIYKNENACTERCIVQFKTSKVFVDFYFPFSFEFTFSYKGSNMK